MTTKNVAAQKYFDKGQEAMGQGKLTQARSFFKKSLETAPSFDAAFLTALTYAQQDNVKMATTFFRQATQINAEIAEGHFNLGYALQLQKDFKAAGECYRAALQRRPDYHAALHNLGVVHEELEELEEAIIRLDDALKLQPNAAETFYNKGSVFLKLGKTDEALAAFDEAIALDPLHVKALNNRGLVYMIVQRYREAMDDFSKAVAIDPEDAELQFNKGQAASRRKILDVAASAFAETVRLKPDHADAWLNRAFALEQLKQNEDSITCFERFLRLQPDAPYARGYLHTARMHLCDWRHYDADASAIMRRIEQNEPAIVPHSLLLLPSTRAQQKQAAEIWVKSCLSSNLPLPFPSSQMPSNDRIRIAYVSSDFHNHPVGILTARLFELHDRHKFEVFAISTGAPTRDATRVRIETAVDHFINAREMSDLEIVQEARAKKIDIAIDMNGYTAENRTSAFALRLAPVQVNFLGYSRTMGATFMDYIIGDPVLIPSDHDNDYTEKVARLPNCYMPADPTREIAQRPLMRHDFDLPEKGFVFCGFNNPYKIAPTQFELWMRILHAVPGSVLWLSPTSLKTSENLRREARNQGIDERRLIFARRMENLSDHLARQKLADLFLDTLPHNAHATSNDALWAGLPILTRLGEGFAGRVAGSLVSAVGLADMIVSDGEDYVRRAVMLATTPGASEKLKKRLIENQRKSALFDDQLYARNIEKAFMCMHQRHQSGLQPQSFNVM